MLFISKIGYLSLNSKEKKYGVCQSKFGHPKIFYYWAFEQKELLGFLSKGQLKLIQGQSRQTGFFELALIDRNMKVRFFWKVVLKFWNLRNFAS